MFEGLFGGASNCDKWILCEFFVNTFRSYTHTHTRTHTAKGKGKGYTAISASEGS